MVGRLYFVSLRAISSMPRFVLEIGTEELPPRFFPVVLPQLKADGEEMLRRARLAFREVKVYGTPRRLALIAEDLADRQAAHTREERGPSVKVAFDAEGKPTKAALGFARRAGVAPESLERRQTDQGEYVFAVVQEPELPAREALAALLPGLITGLSFPKSMRWGTGKLRFGRPIRWLLALVDDQVVEFELEGLKSGRLTRGHPVLAEGMYDVLCAKTYEKELERRRVIVDWARRREIIEERLHEAVPPGDVLLLGIGLRQHFPSESLLADPDEFAREVATNLALQTTFLVEWPRAACGGFDPAFSELPEPVLVEEMQHVQGYFPLRDRRSKKLLPQFVAIRDGGEQGLNEVIVGWESVLRAKLIDAGYFYEQDLKTPLHERVDALQGVVFQEKVGTMYDKTERIRAVAAEAAEQMPAAERVDPAALDRAAALCKADLTTAMVTELPALQGIMGGVYAARGGEDWKVVRAISEHYRPRFAGDELPSAITECLLAVADKLDTITACFAVGIVPTGSADPYGLRREGSGVVRLLADRAVSLSTSRLVRVAVEALTKQIEPGRSEDDVVADVIGFLRQRLEAYLQTSEDDRFGVRYDLVNAALEVGFDDLYGARQRAEALQALSQHADFLPTVIATTRVSNILGDFPGGDVDPNLFQHPTERALWGAYLKVKPTADTQADEGKYEDLFRTLGGLRELIDRFFDAVLVMHEDPAIRRNRLALCWKLSELFRRIADFTLIVQA
jgi:glycyl-tRNA synthetase beta chain